MPVLLRQKKHRRGASFISSMHAAAHRVVPEHTKPKRRGRDIKAQEGGWIVLSGKQSGGGDLHGPDHIQQAMGEQTCTHEQPKDKVK